MKKIKSNAFLVWVNLPTLALKFWEVEVLRGIARAIGDFLVIESKTLSRTRMVSPRICVNVSSGRRPLTCICLSSVHVEVKREIEYEQYLVYCVKCKFVGHGAMFFNGLVQAWKSNLLIFVDRCVAILGPDTLIYGGPKPKFDGELLSSSGFVEEHMEGVVVMLSVALVAGSASHGQSDEKLIDPHGFKTNPTYSVGFFETENKTSSGTEEEEDYFLGYEIEESMKKLAMPSPVSMEKSFMTKDSFEDSRWKHQKRKNRDLKNHIKSDSTKPESLNPAVEETPFGKLEVILEINKEDNLKLSSQTSHSQINLRSLKVLSFWEGERYKEYIKETFGHAIDSYDEWHTMQSRRIK
ncbi:hypothetical protein KI387_037568 [Taxus chinensis]|uniref:DUF4283 domain-containing protein n=1 Tax=Taxus chinensis TaxID=29808 RepID=A0AA38FSR0_TAXCH|nr:hypothetical protein KI387_037568 [Taxus chinensis]